MLISIKTQMDILFFSILSGILVGILFDLYIMFRGYSKTTNIIKVISDMLFCMFAAICIFAFLLFSNSAYLQFYVYFYIALGVLLYLKFISKHFILLHKILFKGILKTFRITINTVFYPFQIIIFKFINKIK